MPTTRSPRKAAAKGSAPAKPGPRKSRMQLDKEQLAGTNPEAILGRAMLVNVCIGNWDGWKHDSEVTAHVNAEMKATADAGRYNKRLFGGKVKELSAVITAATMLRHEHYAQTLPWTDSGWRLLPTANYSEYTMRIRLRIKAYYEAVDKFLVRYLELVEQARAKLNGMFREDDYPSVEQLRRKFHAEIDWSPIAAGTDFRVSLPQEELDIMARNVEERLRESIGAAVNDAWKRLGTSVAKLREKLDDGKYLKDPLIDRLRDVADALGRLNLTNDAKLEEVRHRVLRDLTTFGAETLKADAAIRKSTAQKADEILAAMASVYSPGGDADAAE